MAAGMSPRRRAVCWALATIFGPPVIYRVLVAWVTFWVGPLSTEGDNAIRVSTVLLTIVAATIAVYHLLRLTDDA